VCCVARGSQCAESINSVHPGVARFESTWNWKVMVENWIECYHHLVVHRETVEVFQPAHRTRLVPSEGAGFTPEAVTDYMEMLADIHGEDMVACARVQTGLASGLIDRLRSTPLEAPIADFQRWITARLD
jgi:phenylpropionate dioxygenase-like ring-hydroxylating dioxygenase large terminal subunit